MRTNLLHANDETGTYPDSWYAATATPLPPFSQLNGKTRANTCIVGGGYTGLSAALHLAQAGQRVVLLEAHRAGFGASGRNGGQLGSGQRQDQETLEKMLGRDHAARLWQMGEDAKAMVRDLVASYEIDCYLKPGIAWTALSPREANDLVDYAAFLWDRYDYDQIQPLDAEACAALCPSPAYKGGMLDMGAGHLHPLRLAFGLAQAAANAGAQIYETSEVRRVDEGQPVEILTDQGKVIADHLILACNGYLVALNRQVSRRVIPINNFVIATEPLGEGAKSILTRDVAISDSKFVVNYFRLSHDGRLLFGGGESYGYQFPRDIAAMVRKPMTQIFPHLRDVRIDYAWGGTLGITMNRLPHVARLAPNILSASGYSGHGVGNAIQAGQLMARAIQGESDGFNTMAEIPTPRFPGGDSLRSPLLVLAMTWYALRDRLGL